MKKNKKNADILAIKKWEYLTQPFYFEVDMEDEGDKEEEISLISELLNKNGEDGWELVSVVPMDPNHVVGLDFFLKE